MDTGMKYNQKVGIIVGIATVLIIGIISGCIETEEQKKSMLDNTLQNATQNIKTTASIPAPENITIKVVKFEPTHPCQSCINLGNFAKETMQKHFPGDHESGKITYETVNFQDPKNRDIVKKYNVVGSSLYITVIKDGKEEVIDANDMWNYVQEKEEYMKIFKNKLEEIKNQNV